MLNQNMHVFSIQITFCVLKLQGFEFGFPSRILPPPPRWHFRREWTRQVQMTRASCKPRRSVENDMRNLGPEKHTQITDFCGLIKHVNYLSYLFTICKYTSAKLLWHQCLQVVVEMLYHLHRYKGDSNGRLQDCPRWTSPLNFKQNWC